MLRRIFVCILFMSIFLDCLPQKFINLQTYNVDSLLLILPDQESEEKVKSLNNLAVSLSVVEYEQSKQYTDQAMDLAIELEYQEGIAYAFRNYGHMNFSSGNYPLALNNYHEALLRYEKIDEKNTVGWVCYDIAKTHYCANNFEKTIEYGNMALDVFREPQMENLTIGNVRDTLSIYEGLALTYGKLERTNKAINLFQEVLKVGKNNNFGMTELLIITFTIGGNYFSTGMIDSAKLYFEKALAFPDLNMSIEALKYRPLAWLGDIHYLSRRIDSAVLYKQKAFDWYYEHGFLYWAMNISNQLGYIYYSIEELNTAKMYFQQSEMIFNEMQNKNSWYRSDSLKYIVNFGIELFFPFPHRQLTEMMWIEAKSMYYKLYQIYDKTQSTKNALKYHVSYFNAVDTLNKLQRSGEMIELQTKYETERKEEQIVSLSQQNAFQEFRLKQSSYFLLGLGGLFFMVVILAIVLIRQNKLRDQQKNLLLQQKLFRSQMNPHFIFNSLTNIQNFILDEEAHKANKYLSRFSKLVRNILESSVEEYFSLEEEIRTIENYLELQKVRFPDKFDYTIEIDKGLDPEIVKIPPMLAQPFIENSLEHGFKHKKEIGNLQIRFVLSGQQIRFEVEDDGIGRDKAREILFKQNKDHKSIATTITRERIKLLNKKSKKNITLDIQDLRSENDEAIGTKVIFEIPTIFS